MARRKTKTTTGLQSPKAKVNITISPESKSTLDKIASEIGLSRSAFFEGILNGSISLSSQQAHQLVSLKLSTESSQTHKANAPLEVNIINDLNEQENIPSTQLTQEEIEAEKEKISVLEKQVSEKENILVETNKLNKSLQEKFDNQLSIITSLKAELEKITTSKKDSDKSQKISNSLAGKVDNLQQEISIKNNLIQELKQQINSQQQEIQKLQIKASAAIVTKQKDTELESLNRQQKDTITRLENRIAELQTVASIGSQTLNKWRSKMYR